MPYKLRHRFWIEAVLGLVAGILALATLFWRDWIETVFRVDPDRGNGSAEWLVVLTLAVITVTMTIAARREWRRAAFAQ